MAPQAGKRLAFIVSSLQGGDPEAAGVAWMNWFVQAGYEVDAILVSHTRGSELVDPSVQVHRIAARRGHAAKTAAVRRILRGGNYDAVIALQTYPNLLAIAAAGRKGSAHRPIVIVTEHDLLSLGLPGSSLSHRAGVWLAKRWYRRADVVTSASHPAGAEIAAAFRVPASRSLVIPDPAMAGVTDRVPVHRTPGTDNGVQLVMVGPLEPRKRPHLAILAAKSLGDRGIPTDVVSFGGGPLRAELAGLADRLGVRFTPNSDGVDWVEHLTETSVVILPSRGEGLGGVLIEAAARGVPSVAVSTALGVADAIIPGITGELALDEDPESIADAVERAAHLHVDGVDEWLERFSADSSGGLLESAIGYAYARRDA